MTMGTRGNNMNNEVFAAVPGTDATMFIQWKGTDLCMDLYCPCGDGPHIDSEFAYYVECGCGKVYQMGTQVLARLVDKDSLPDGAKTVKEDSPPGEMNRRTT